eukprot:tig00021572_g22409.t1
MKQKAEGKGLFGKDKVPKLQQSITKLFNVLPKVEKPLPRGALDASKASTPEQAAFRKRVASELEKREAKRRAAAASRLPKTRCSSSREYKSFAAALALSFVASDALEHLERVQSILSDHKRALAEGQQQTPPVAPTMAEKDAAFLSFPTSVEKVLVPWRDEVRARAENPDLRPVIVLDNHVSHTKNTKYMEERGFTLLWLPPRCSSALQPLDQAFNKAVKEMMRRELALYLVELRRRRKVADERVADGTRVADAAAESAAIRNKFGTLPQARERSVAWLAKIWNKISDELGPMVQGCWRKTGFYNAAWPGRAGGEAPAAEATSAEATADEPDIENESDVSDTGLSDAEELSSSSDSEDEDEETFGNEDA